MPEDVLKKHKSKWSEDSYYHRDDVIAAMTEYASLNRQGCRWVKASELLPESDSPNYHFRLNGFDKVNGNFCDISNEGEIVFWVNGCGAFEDYYIYKKDFDKIEWLSESIEPCATSSDAIGFADWVGNGFKMLALNNIWECFNDDYCDGKNIQLDYHYTTEQLYTIYQNQKQKVNE